MTTTYTETNIPHATGFGVNTETGLARGGAGETAVLLMGWADSVLENVKGQTDERLIECAKDAKDLERAAFRVRGGCGLELKDRIKQRQIDTGDKVPIGKHMSELAQEIGIAVKTLEDDIRIASIFSDILRGDTELDREYFLRALPAKDPHAVIEWAMNGKASTPGFSASDVQEFVRRENGGEDREKLERESWIKIPLNPAQKDALEYLKHRRNKAPKELFGDWLVSEADVSRSTK